MMTPVRRCRRRQMSLTAVTLALACVSSLWGGVIELNETYTRDPSAGYFPAGRIGRCAGIWHSQGMVYPVVFTRRHVPQGTLSVWFRPAKRGYFHDYDAQWIVGLPGLGRSLRGHIDESRQRDDTAVTRLSGDVTGITSR